MKTKNDYILITYYDYRGDYYDISIYDTKEEAMKEAKNKIKKGYATKVEIYKPDKTEWNYYGKLIYCKSRK